MLDRYQSAQTYTAAAYASKVSKSLTDKQYNGESMLKNMFDTTDDMSDWMKRTESDNTAIWKGTSTSKDAGIDWTVHGNSSSNIFKDGTMKATISGTDLSFKGKLSTLSMYNYLSTSFGSSSIVTYSNSTSISEHTQKAHASVTSVGSGLLGIMFTANLWACLFITAVIGVIYAIGTVFDTLKMSVKLITSIPLSALGFIKSAAQVIVYTLYMVFQVIIGAFMYSFMSEFILVFASLVESLVSSGGGITDYTTSMIIGGRFLAIFETIMPEIVLNSNFSVYAMILFEIGLCVVFGGMLFAYRRAVARVWAMSWERAMFMVTFAECQETFEQIWHGETETIGLTERLRTGVYVIADYLRPATLEWKGAMM